MLTTPCSDVANGPAPRRQSGVVLMVALIVLIAMTLAGLALMRSLDTANLIAGNMAFQQAATHSADGGVEAAIAWLEGNNTAGPLYNPIPAFGYSPKTDSVSDANEGAAFWNTWAAAAGVCVLPIVANACSAVGTPDASGNVISFMIQRLCSANGAPSPATCVSSSGTNGTAGSNEGAGEDQLQFNTAVYYRITVRVDGPRNSLSIVQAVVSL